MFPITNHFNYKVKSNALWLEHKTRGQNSWVGHLSMCSLTPLSGEHHTPLQISTLKPGLHEYGCAASRVISQSIIHSNAVNYANVLKSSVLNCLR